MDRRTLLAMVLVVAIYYGWMVTLGPQPEPVDESPTVEEPSPAVVAPTPLPVPVDVPDVPERTVDVELCGMSASLSSSQGLQDARLDHHTGPYDVMPLYSWLWGQITGSVSGGWHPWGAADPGPAEIVGTGGRALAMGSGASPATSPPAKMRISQQGETWLLQGVTEDGIEVEQRIKETEVNGHCVLDVGLTWRNPTDRRYDGDLWVSMHDAASDAGSGMTARYSSSRQPTAFVDGSLNYGGALGAGCVQAGTQLTDDEGEQSFTLEGPVSWFGVSDRYFGFYLIPDNPSAGSAVLSRLGSEETAQDGVHLAIKASLGPDESRSERFTAYVGPNDMGILDEIHEDLGEVVDLGFFAIFGYPLLLLLRVIYAGVGNWGLAIIILTFIVKVIFFPMTDRSFRSMQKMQKLQPELNKIREEMADNPQDMNRKIFEVMQENKVNPAAGCFPMLVQMPVWFALYNVLLTSVDLYHTEFLYLKDLTQPDPYLVLPIAIMVLMFVQQQFTTPTNMDPAQQQVMRLMPLFFGLLFFAFPSGLGIYVFVNMVLSNLQQWLIKRRLDAGDPPAAAGAPA